MTRTARALAALALAALAVPLTGVAPAYAETSSEVASNGAYFYSAGIDKPEQSPAVPPNITGDRTDGVEPGHLAAAVRVPNQADKFSFLFFDLLELGFDSTVSSAVVTLPLAEGGGNMQMNPAPEKVKACPADATGFAGQDGQNTAGAPGRMCDVFSATATATEDGKAYRFEITAMASSWVTEANNGMSIEPADLSSPFQVVFKPFTEARIDVEYTPSADSLLDPEDIEPETFADDTFTSDPSSDFSTSTDSGSTSFGGGSFDTGSATAAQDLGFGVADLPAIDSELPDPAAADAASVPEPAVAGNTVSTRAASSFSESLSPTAGLLFGSLLLVGLLAGLSLIMGDPSVPASAAGGRPSRLSQALQSRDRVRGLMTRSTPQS